MEGAGAVVELVSLPECEDQEEGMNPSARIGLGVVLVSSISLGVATAALRAGGGVEPAAEGEATYSLSNLRLGDLFDTAAGEFVLVTYDGAWSGASFPGMAQCEIRVQDGGRALIGSKEFQLGSYVPSFSDTTEVRIFGIPASVSAVCAAADRPSADAGYDASNPRIVDTEDGPRLVFDVRWKTTEPPLLQSCEATLQLPDGSEAAFGFELSVPPGEATVLVPPDLDRATPVGIECQTFAG